MIHLNSFRTLALSFPETIEEPHFEKISFRVRRKIFATVDPVNRLACLKLSAIDQDVFTSVDGTIIYPVGNQWGKQGWTLFEMRKVKKDIIAHALRCAYGEVAPKKLAAPYTPNSDQ